MARICNVFNLLRYGSIPYKRGWQYQRALVEKINSTKKSGKESQDAVIVLQHDSVYSLGRGAKLENIKFSLDEEIHEVVRVERGGEVTWHGPGQIVAYPIIDLNQHKKDLHW